jgi:hypothetical protein
MAGEGQMNKAADYFIWKSDCDQLLESINRTQTSEYPFVSWGSWFNNGFQPADVVEHLLSASVRESESAVLEMTKVNKGML